MESEPVFTMLLHTLCISDVINRNNNIIVWTQWLTGQLLSKGLEKVDSCYWTVDRQW